MDELLESAKELDNSITVKTKVVVHEVVETKVQLPHFSKRMDMFYYMVTGENEVIEVVDSRGNEWINVKTDISAALKPECEPCTEVEFLAVFEKIQSQQTLLVSNAFNNQ